MNEKALKVKKSIDKNMITKQERSNKQKIANNLQQNLFAQKDLKVLQKKQKQREKTLNRKLQQIVKNQEEERKKEQSAIEQEIDLIKKAHLENKAALNELTRKAQLQQALWQTIDQNFSSHQALEESRNLRKEIVSLEQFIDDQYLKNLFNLDLAFIKHNQFSNLTFPAKPPQPLQPKSFENLKYRDDCLLYNYYQYRDRLNHYHLVKKSEKEFKKKNILIRREQEINENILNDEWLMQKINILSPFVERLKNLQLKKFSVLNIPIIIKIGEPEADHFRFPMIIICQKKHYKRYWDYSNQALALNLWKKRKNFKGIAVQQLTDCQNAIQFIITGCYVTNYGITENRFYSFKKTKTFKEIDKLNALISEIKGTKSK